ncbi:hypothetical protein SERLA73DRAFT_186328 [Serpula lacrymans var. lacrymans S7.3]|uniref:Uncharacterized protein n=1 Tax=Serpula lacrymans var. lacrymans (strain S7.3) TaxID=936435 RepID=F8Q747_SERL3|nr:hypothetical protein SERLA73DRAFT_186328 [Serpula lacrymans var. lacrymans S7.3]
MSTCMRSGLKEDAGLDICRRSAASAAEVNDLWSAVNLLTSRLAGVRCLLEIRCGSKLNRPTGEDEEHEGMLNEIWAGFDKGDILELLVVEGRRSFSGFMIGSMDCRPTVELSIPCISSSIGYPR